MPSCPQTVCVPLVVTDLSQKKGFNFLPGGAAGTLTRLGAFHADGPLEGGGGGGGGEPGGVRGPGGGGGGGGGGGEDGGGEEGGGEEGGD